VIGAVVVVTAWTGACWTSATSASSAPMRSSTVHKVAAQNTTTTVAHGDEAPDVPAEPAGGPGEPAATDAGTAPTVPTVPSTTTPALEERVNESDQATTRLNRVVIGLVILAGLIAAATAFFWFRTRPERGAATSVRPARQVRTGAIVIGSDGTEHALVDPGPAAFASDDWVVDPPPRLPAPSEVGRSVPAPAPAAASEPPLEPASSGAIWWASQAGEPGSAPAGHVDAPAGGVDVPD